MVLGLQCFNLQDSFMWVHPSELGKVEYAGDDRNFMGKYDPWIRGGAIPNVRMP